MQSAMKPATLVVVSPHRDDAALSAGLTISRWAALEWPVTVINCFTISAYAPNRPELSAPEVTNLRRAEDEAFASTLGGTACFEDLAMLDAPLRLCCSSDIVCGMDDEHFGEAVRSTADGIRKLLEGSRALDAIVLAPLAIGDHIDHRVVREACLHAGQSVPIAFYEDLPYAAMTDARVMAAEIAEVRPLVPVVISMPAAAARKSKMVRLYSSQLSDEEEAQIAFHTAAVGGERLWADARSYSLLANLSMGELVISQ